MLRDVFICIGVAALAVPVSVCQAQIAPSEITQVAVLGSGTPFPDPDRSGPAVAIVVNDEPYIVDFGPGVIRRAAALSSEYGGAIEGLNIVRIRHAFLTHFHSDHTAGYADLILTPWTHGRAEPLQVFGPEGIVEMTEHLLKAYSEDIRYRLYSLEPANNQGWRVQTHVVSEGLVFKDENISVEAFAVRHGSWPNAFGYRFTTPDRTIVISGDAAPDKNLEAYSAGADILLHEVYSAAGAESLDSFWQRYHGDNHTSTRELAAIASRAKPKLLVLYHVLGFGVSDEDILAEFKEDYDGNVVIASDLDIF